MFSLPLLFAPTGLFPCPSARTLGRKRRRLAAAERRASCAPHDVVKESVAEGANVVIDEGTGKLDEVMATNRTLITNIDKLSVEVANMKMDLESVSQHFKLENRDLVHRVEATKAEIARVDDTAAAAADHLREVVKGAVTCSHRLNSIFG